VVRLRGRDSATRKIIPFEIEPVCDPDTDSDPDKGHNPGRYLA